MSTQLPSLIVNAKEFKEKLQERIKIGLENRGKSASDFHEFIENRGAFTSWDSYNIELIKRAFDEPNSEYLKEYISAIPDGIYKAKDLYHTIYEHVGFALLNQAYLMKVKRLESLKDKIDLMTVSSNVSHQKDGESKLEQQDLLNELSKLHPLVKKTSGKLFANGHYRQAILDTYIAIVESVQKKSQISSLDNTPLMQKVFSQKDPIISVSEDPDEQLGFMWLFTGAIMGIRNPKAHHLIEQDDPQRALEWLSFASVLLRVLDDSKVTDAKIFSAKYGVPGNEKDVTNAIQNLVTNKIYSGVVLPNTFNISDHLVGTPKTLTIHFRIFGKEENLSFVDGQMFSIK